LPRRDGRRIEAHEARDARHPRLERIGGVRARKLAEHEAVERGERVRQRFFRRKAHQQRRERVRSPDDVAARATDLGRSTEADRDFGQRALAPREAAVLLVEHDLSDRVHPREPRFD
jgi:hypothetical protein